MAHETTANLVEGLIATMVAAVTIAERDHERAAEELHRCRENLPQALKDCGSDEDLLEGVKQEYLALDELHLEALNRVTRLGDALRSLKQANGYR